MSEAEWTETIRVQFGFPDNDEGRGLAGYILWNHTCWPFGTDEMVRAHIDEYQSQPAPDADE